MSIEHGGPGTPSERELPRDDDLRANAWRIIHVLADGPASARQIRSRIESDIQSDIARATVNRLMRVVREYDLVTIDGRDSGPDGEAHASRRGYLYALTERGERAHYARLSRLTSCGRDVLPDDVAEEMQSAYTALENGDEGRVDR